MLVKLKGLFKVKKTDKYLTKEQQIKRSFFKGLSISVALCLVVVLLYNFLVIPHVRDEERKNVLAATEKQSKSKQPVYRLNKDLTQGSVISDKDLTQVEQSADDLPNDVIADKGMILNKILRLDMKNKEIVTASMLTPPDNAVTNDLRKQDYTHIVLNKDLKKGDYVDIRLKMKDGLDFIVASKKKIFDLNGTTMFVRITEGERTYINNATVVASLNGATIYTTVYVDPENQPKANITYQLDSKVSKLIEENSNLVKQSQQEIINRNTQPTQPTLTSPVSSSVSGNTSNSNNAIQNATSSNRAASIEGGK